MDRVREYLDGLEIQDPRHELAKNPTMVPSDWDRSKYRPVVSGGLDGTMTCSYGIISRRLQPLPPIRDPSLTALRRESLAGVTSKVSSDTCSSALSLASSSSTYSSVFSADDRSASTGPSLYNASYMDSRERFEHHAPTIYVQSEPQPRRRFERVRRPILGAEFSIAGALYEEDVVIKESRDVIITKPNPQMASLDGREIPYERGQCIIHDLRAEERHQGRDKKQKEQLHKEWEKERQPQTAIQPCLMEFGSISQTTDASLKPGPDTNQAAGSLTAQMTEDPSHNLSQMLSQTDSDISDDATDWEEDSDDESFLPHNHEEKLELEPSFVQNYLTPMQLQVVERLMTHFWNIFNDRWSVGIRQHGSATDGSNQSTSSTTSESESSSWSSLRACGGKRSRSNDREDDETGDGPGRRRKQHGKLPAVQEIEDVERQFACPFRKRDPWKYSVQEWPRCALKPQKTIARLK